MITKPWLYLPANWAHNLSPIGLKIYSFIFGQEQTPEWNGFHFKNLSFKNRLGTAGGLDKNGDHLTDWNRMGCGFLEIGTVTPQPQSPNPGKIIDRDYHQLAVWNKMGFPSVGAHEVLYNIRKFRSEHSTPVFVNIGKNRTTSNEDAHSDYVFLLEHFQNDCDAFVINISSPNTAGLRDLGKTENFLNFLKPITKKIKELQLKQSVFLKISPDLDRDSLENIVLRSIDEGLDGFILTNTTLDRSQTPNFPSEGGVSGAPLKQKSIAALDQVFNIIKKQNVKKCIISAGGVMTAEDVFERIEKGADLVQVYSTLIFKGPTFFRKVAQVARQQYAEKNFSPRERESQLL